MAKLPEQNITEATANSKCIGSYTCGILESFFKDNYVLDTIFFDFDRRQIDPRLEKLTLSDRTRDYSFSHFVDTVATTYFGCPVDAVRQRATFVRNILPQKKIMSPCTSSSSKCLCTYLFAKINGKLQQYTE